MSSTYQQLIFEGLTQPPNDFSSSLATEMVSKSLNGEPMICIPTGSPSLVSPRGQAVTGRPSVLNTHV